MFSPPSRSQNWLKTRKLADLDAVDFKELKSRGFSDSQIGRAIGEGFRVKGLAGGRVGPLVSRRTDQLNGG